MRIVGCILLVFAFTAVGVALSAGLSRRVKKLEAALSYIGRVSDEIRYSGDELEGVLARSGGTVYIKNGVWCGTDGLSSDDLEVLCSFQSVLGTTDTEGQTENARIHSEMLKKRLYEAQTEKNKQSRLYVSLGFFAGMFAAILLV